jgi:hypothetical protein
MEYHFRDIGIMPAKQTTTTTTTIKLITLKVTWNLKPVSLLIYCISCMSEPFVTILTLGAKC